MWDFHAEAQTFIDNYVKDESIRSSLQAYLDYVIKRKK
jgi:polyprenyl synthetase